MPEPGKLLTARPKITEKKTDSSPKSLNSGTDATACAASATAKIASSEPKIPLTGRPSTAMQRQVSTNRKANMQPASSHAPPPVSVLGMAGIPAGKSSASARIATPASTITQSSVLS